MKVTVLYIMASVCSNNNLAICGPALLRSLIILQPYHRCSCHLSLKSLLVVFLSRLCSPGVPRRPEAHPHGGDEVPGHSTRRPLPSAGQPPQNGDPERGRPQAGSAATQAQAPRHEHPHAIWILSSPHAFRCIHRPMKRSAVRSRKSFWQHFR